MSSKIQLTELPERWTLPFKGKVVTRCLVDSAFSLEFWDANNGMVILRIEGGFVFKSGTVTHTLLPGGQPMDLCPALTLLHKSVEEAIAWKDGRLEISFTGNNFLLVSWDSEGEAWEISSSDGLRFISLPGGSLAVWVTEQ